MVISLYSIYLIFILILPDNAYAYVDSGTGSMVLQALLAGFSGVVVVAQLWWNRIRGKAHSHSSVNTQVDG